ncbi:stage II sporulation protein P [Desulfuribacillus alkaliarsenatis]|uniref:Stage II sporulation protein P n=1 Tax=Desulfuribacillus alkaliarsenatis TaxID=766136 RepID=A0A1E5G078_9FIRM|nr:stage II sporulation protein P [Desulfuribacillus alkaliarsenatis]OEF96245.1 hypothetical protein BHF68_08765 [Desulfuribacillus alkaliarsenatis]
MPINRRKFRTVMLNLSSSQRKKTFITFVLSAMFLVIILSLTISSVESLTSSTDDKSRVEQLVNKVSVATYKNVLQSEIKALPATNHVATFYGTGYELDSFFAKLFTGIEMRNLQSILYQEIPGFSIMAAELIGDRSQLDIYAPPVEIAPRDYLFSNDDLIQDGRNQDQSGLEQPDNQLNQKPLDKEPDSDKKPINIDDRPPILIYHTHNREAYLPELDGVNRANEAFHASNNITLVGKHLAEELNKLGIPTIHSSRDYWVELPHGAYSKSYVYSKDEVESILAENENIPFIFDIHRDSAPRSRTTVEHNGETYAAVWFIIGQLNPTWQFNYQFAAKIEGMIEDRVPSISRGIWAKKAGQYNQDLSPNNVLIEIGGVDNTLEEAKRTAKVLADIIAELYLEEIQ